MKRVALLAGGVGGAKMAEGFDALSDVDLTVIGNVADDEEFHGLWVSPDIDTLTYTLAGRINRDQGWGVADEAGRALEVLKTLGEDTWMYLGDRDFGLHIYRTARRAHGDRPSEIARDVAAAFGVRSNIVLPTDDRVQTRVKTARGWITFQDYFVRQQSKPTVQDLRFDGIASARPTPEALAALAAADRIVIAPSNPLVSIRPILEIPGITEAVRAASVPVIAVSPLIAGRVVKGPADRMMTAMGYHADVAGIAQIYAEIADVLVIDHQDKSYAGEVGALGLHPVASQIYMRDLSDKTRLAREIADIDVTVAA
ncbi:MAG: 2-phospho-L-lactate transferase [Pseudomonadota bacterium]